MIGGATIYSPLIGAGGAGGGSAGPHLGDHRAPAVDHHGLGPHLRAGARPGGGVRQPRGAARQARRLLQPLEQERRRVISEVSQDHSQNIAAVARRYVMLQCHFYNATEGQGL